jgi:hypothetical protein
MGWERQRYRTEHAVRCDTDLGGRWARLGLQRSHAELREPSDRHYPQFGISCLGATPGDTFGWAFVAMDIVFPVPTVDVEVSYVWTPDPVALWDDGPRPQILSPASSRQRIDDSGRLTCVLSWSGPGT